MERRLHSNRDGYWQTTMEWPISRGKLNSFCLHSVSIGLDVFHWHVFVESVYLTNLVNPHFLCLGTKIIKFLSEINYVIPTHETF
jgi:hypothetical protein